MILGDAKTHISEILGMFNRVSDARTKRDLWNLVVCAQKSEDYYDKEGYCLTCLPSRKKKHKTGDGCLCYECKCRKCFWYEFKVFDLDKDYYEDYKKCCYWDYHEHPQKEIYNYL